MLPPNPYQVNRKRKYSFPLVWRIKFIKKTDVPLMWKSVLGARFLCLGIKKEPFLTKRFFGTAGGGIRTHTGVSPTDFESVTSASSITPACLVLAYNTLFLRESQPLFSSFLKNLKKAAIGGGCLCGMVGFT